MRRYPGPPAFTKDQKDLFFGRDDDIRQLSNLIYVERKVLLYSVSGYGKSSLLNAGIIPEFQNIDKDFNFIFVRFNIFSDDGKTPNSIFLKAIKEHPDFKKLNKAETIIDEYAKEHLDEYWCVFKKNQLVGNRHKTYVLVFDQFEELFSYPIEQIEEFKTKLSVIIYPNKHPQFFNTFEDRIFNASKNINKEDIDELYLPANVKVVFAIRSDRLSELNNLVNKMPDIQKVFYELKPLTREQAKQAIVEPAGKKGDYESIPFSFEDKAVDKIINDLTLNGQEDIPTTQLQIVCQQIEEEFIPTQQQGSQELKINNNDSVVKLHKLPDFKDLFRNFYSESVKKVTSDVHENVQQFIEDHLINKGRRIPLDEIVCQDHVSLETLNTLVHTRLIRREQNSVGSYSYEISHDTLVPPILEMAEVRYQQEAIKKERDKALKVLAARKKERRRQKLIIEIVSVAAITCFTLFLYANRQQKITKQSLKVADSLTLEAQHSLEIAEKAKNDALNALNKLDSQKINSLANDTKGYLVNGFIEYADTTLMRALEMDRTNQQVLQLMDTLENHKKLDRHE